MEFSLRKLNRHQLSVLDSATKYPSIPTYHKIGDKGLMSGEPTVQFRDRVIVTEKIDGTNVRIIITANDFIIGSRAELLSARNDFIYPAKHGIVETMRPVAEALSCRHYAPNDIIIVYFEYFGGDVGKAARQYSTEDMCGYRIIDVAFIGHDAFRRLRNPEDAASWRDNGGQIFADEEELIQFSHTTGIKLTPRMNIVPAGWLPPDVIGMHDVLQSYTHTTRSAVTLDNNAYGSIEGFVIRSFNRNAIAKARVRDYRRTVDALRT